MILLTHAILTASTLLAPSDPPAQASDPTPSVSLRPITERPDDPARSNPQPMPDPDLAAPTRLSDGTVSFVRAGNRALPFRSAFLMQSIEGSNDDLLTSLARRARAGYAYDADLEPIFSDRDNIDLATNTPGDHSESHFTLTNVQLARGIYFRADGVGRAFDAEKRYTTLSAEAYFSLGANAGMSLGFDVVRTGLPSEDITSLMDDGLFARFIIDF